MESVSETNVMNGGIVEGKLLDKYNCEDLKQGHVFVAYYPLHIVEISTNCNVTPTPTLTICIQKAYQTRRGESMLTSDISQIAPDDCAEEGISIV